MEEVKAEGLKWMKRGTRKVPYWVADEQDVKNGYVPKTINLDKIRDNPELLKAQCEVYQAEARLWRAGYRREAMTFDGSIKSLFRLYQTHPESEFHNLKQTSLVPYKHYLEIMTGHIGQRNIESVSGIDIKKWHRVWSDNGKHLAASKMCRAILRAALSFGVQAKADGAGDLIKILEEANKDIPNPKPRTTAMSAEQVIAARLAAHKRGRPSAALAYALAFETVLRLWDVIGQWVPIDSEGISDIIDEKRGGKWFGLRWEDIGPDMVLIYKPSKTEGTTGRTIQYPLYNAPMVLEELAYWPVEKRVGPVIVGERTKKPYREGTFRDGWSRDRIEAKIPASVWARDLRASGVTEGRASNVSVDDVAKVAGHSKRMTENVYDRTTIEAAERFANKRIEKRSGNDSE